MLAWISFYSLDALGRIALKIVATVLFARWLSPQVFGMASLTIVLVSVLAIFVSAPFEEALAQRRVVRSAHFAASLMASLIVGGMLIALAVGASTLVGQVTTGATVAIAHLVALFSVFLLAHGPVSIYTAIARRHRAFGRIAWSNLAGDVVGTTVGLAWAYMGGGVWSLLAVRLIGRFVTLAWLVIGASITVVPRWSSEHLRDLSGFAGWILAMRCVVALSDALFQAVVARLFGLAGAGYLNMALRVIEPVRGVTQPMSHNIATSFFARSQASPGKLRQVVERTMANTSLILLPLYVGIAAIAPTVVAAIAGPTWSVAAPLIVWLALASALTSPTNFVMSALAAQGRMRACFLAALLEFVLVMIAVVALSPWGLAVAGAARLISNAGEVIAGIAIARASLGMSARRIMRQLLPILSSASVMGIAVAAIGRWGMVIRHHPLAGLPLQVAAGLVIFALLALVFHRQAVVSTVASLKGGRGSSVADGIAEPNA